MHIRRLVSFLILLLGISAIAAGGIAAVSARPAANGSGMHRLLILDSQWGTPYDEIRLSLLKALEGYGYAEGKNLKVTVRFSGNDIGEGRRILERENASSYDVVFVGGTSATISAKEALYGAKLPVVFGSPTDPAGIGVIKSITDRPSANFTGVCYPVPVKTRLRFLMRLMPKARTFGLIYADMPQSRSYNRWLEDLLKHDPEFREIRIIYRPVPLVTGEKGDWAMAESSRRIIRELDPLVDAYIKPCDQMGTRRHFSEVVNATSKKPLIGLVRDDVMGNWGAMAAIFPLHSSIGQQAARMIKELFEGRPVSDVTPEWPQKYGFAIDLRKARRFGVDVPVELLQMAGENIIR